MVKDFMDEMKKKLEFVYEILEKNTGLNLSELEKGYILTILRIV